MSAAAIESAINRLLVTPILGIRPNGLQEYFARLLLGNLKSPVQDKLNFLIAQFPDYKIEKKWIEEIKRVASARNALVHSAYEHQIVHHWPDDFEPQQHTTITEFPRKGILSYKGWGPNMLEKAEAHYESAFKIVPKLDSIKVIIPNPK